MLKFLLLILLLCLYWVLMFLKVTFYSPLQVLDSYIFAFWAKMPTDVEPKRIRLKSNSYTTNTILDTVTAASVQVSELYYAMMIGFSSYLAILL